MRVERFATEAGWIAAVSRDLEEAQERAAAEGRGAELLLSGGSTPEPLYLALSALRLKGPRIRLWLGDERAVPRGDSARNGRLIERCFSSVAWESGMEFVAWPEGGRETAAREFSEILAAVFGPAPRFDLALLGIGEDGHTAGLFPGDPESELALIPSADPAQRGPAFATLAPAEPRERISLGIEALARSSRLRFVTRGGRKAEVIERVQTEQGLSLPTRRVADRAVELGAEVAFYHFVS